MWGRGARGRFVAQQQCGNAPMPRRWIGPHPPTHLRCRLHSHSHSHLRISTHLPGRVQRSPLRQQRPAAQVQRSAATWPGAAAATTAATAYGAATAATASSRG